MDYTARSEARTRMPEMPGWSVHWACSRLTLSHQILAGNGRDLSDFLEHAPAVPAPALPASELRQFLMPAQFDASRLLHNFATAASSLVDHSRCTSRRHLSEDARAQYSEAVVSQFGTHQPRIFVQALRNYFVHVSCPILATRVAFGQGSTSLWLVRERLLDYSGWNSSTKKFLRDCNEDIPIGPLAGSYQTAAFEVTARLVQLIIDEHVVELNELYELSNAVAAAVEAEGLDADDPLIQRFGNEPASKALQRTSSGRR